MKKCEVPPERRGFRGAVKDIIGGTIGGTGLVFVGHPFDTMKVRLQTQPFGQPLYGGLVDCARKTFAGEGVLGFYKGVFSPLAGQMFLNATQFFAWGQAIKIVGEDKCRWDLTSTDYAIAGVITGFACAMVETPIDFFKSQLQTQIFKQQPLFTTVPQAVRHVLKHYGIRGAYQGLSATIVRNIPFRSSYFFTYETVLSAISHQDTAREDVPFYKIMLGGGVAGFVQWFLCYPLDVVKSSMQTDSIVKSERKYKNYAHCVKTLYKTHGVKAFFRGWTPCMLRSAPANACCLYFYEKSLTVLDKLF